MRHGCGALDSVFSAASPNDIISFSCFLRLTRLSLPYVSMLPMAVHAWFECDHDSVTCTSANRRKQLSISATEVQSGLMFISVLVFRNVMTTPHSRLTSPLIFPFGSVLASSE